MIHATVMLVVSLLTIAACCLAVVHLLPLIGTSAWGTAEYILSMVILAVATTLLTRKPNG